MISKADFCTYIKKHENAMYAVAYSIVKNEHDASDAVGEAILKAYARLDTLKNPEAFKTWILRIVHNEAVELIRKITPTVEIEEAYDVPIEHTESKHTEKIDLHKAMEKLPQPYRTVITLYYYEELPMTAIAEITDTSTISVRQQLSRGRKQIRQMLKEDFLHE